MTQSKNFGSLIDVENRGAHIALVGSKQAPPKSGDGRADDEREQLIESDVIADELAPELILPYRDQDTAGIAAKKAPNQVVRDGKSNEAQPKHIGREKRRVRCSRPVQRRHGIHAMKAAEGSCADAIPWIRGRVREAK